MTGLLKNEFTIANRQIKMRLKTALKAGLRRIFCAIFREACFAAVRYKFMVNLKWDRRMPQLS